MSQKKRDVWFEKKLHVIVSNPSISGTEPLESDEVFLSFFVLLLLMFVTSPAFPFCCVYSRIMNSSENIQFFYFSALLPWNLTEFYIILSFFVPFNCCLPYRSGKSTPSEWNDSASGSYIIIRRQFNQKDEFLLIWGIYIYCFFFGIWYYRFLSFYVEHEPHENPVDWNWTFLYLVCFYQSRMKNFPFWVVPRK